MHSLFYRNQNLNSYIVFNTHPILTFLILILYILKLNTAELTIYDSSNNEIKTYENIDIMGIHKPAYGVSGQLFIASFVKPNNDKDDACKIINLPLIEEDTILVVPFHDAYNVGCMSYSDIIKSNNWEYNDDVDIPSSKVPNDDNDDGSREQDKVPKETVNAPKTPDDPINNKNPPDTTPADKNPPDDTPKDTNPDNTPKDTPKDTNPENTPKDTTTDKTPKDTTTDNTPKDTTTDNTPKDTTTDNTPKDTTTDNTPKDTTPDTTSRDSTSTATTPTDKSTPEPTKDKIIELEVSANIPPVETKVKVGLRRRQDISFKYIPKVIVFTSTNEGEPGIKEFSSGDRGVLEKSIPGLTLLKHEDISELKEIRNEISRAKITSGQSKWYDLVTSSSWIALSVIMGIIYVIIIIVSTFLLVSYYKKFGFAVKNIKFYIYPGIALVCILGIIILTVDPGNIHEERISLFAHAFISNSKDLLLFIIFTILEIQWKKAASIICQTHQHYSKHTTILSKIYSYILSFCITVFMFGFLIKTLSFLNTTTTWFKSIIKLAYVLESVSVGFVGIEFILFGVYIFTALRKKVQRQNLRYKRKVTAVKVLIMNISFAFAILLFVVTESLQFLIPTIVNLWLHLALGNIGTVVACIIIMIVLQDEIIGKHLQLAKTNRNFDNMNDHDIRSSSSDSSSSIDVTSIATPETMTINRLSLDAPPVSTLSTPRHSLSSPRPSLSSTRPPRNLTTIVELPLERNMSTFSSTNSETSSNRLFHQRLHSNTSMLLHTYLNNLNDF
ncbi:4276_t:CDS:2 [Funneliformis geosporum]|uniref:4276_t:CDS:1 n=1 Tax=Funneliformis geosporum TaxID=1117311 RepID=A0A9W4WM48_9GLOM|nr:4276_t:CDS:2 [Funneliformis geosporum]